MALIDQMLLDMKSVPALYESDFGRRVRVRIQGIRAHIEDGGFFSHRMEMALENWNYAIAKHLVDHYNTVQ